MPFLHCFFVISGVLCCLSSRIVHLFAFDEFSHRLNFTRMSDEPMPQQFLSCWSLLWIFYQAAGNEISKVLTPPAPFQSWRWRFRNQKEYFHGVCASVWWLSICKFHGRDSQRPNICFEVVTCFLDYFRGHPERRSHESHALRFNVGELRGDPKVCNFDSPILSEKYVGGLNVAVNLAGLVEIVKTI